MIKRLLPVLLALALLPGPAHAETVPSAVRHAMANLTEVYGYTQEEAEAFTFDYTQTETEVRVEYYPPGHPTWVYVSANDITTGQYVSSGTPFAVSGFTAYPGENAVRDGLRQARENNWFTDLSAENRAAFLEWMERWGVRADETLVNGLTTGNITPAQAVHAYFTSCYGDPSGWLEALREWHDEELASYGLDAEDAAGDFILSQTEDPALVASRGVKRYEAKVGRYLVAVTEFAGEVPAELAQALAHPGLASWTCVAGAYHTVEQDAEEATSDVGLLALEKDGARLLVSIQRPSETEGWTVQPVGERALLSAGELYITYEATDNVFALAYRISDTQTESFRVRIQHYTEQGTVLCRLVEYRRVDTAADERVVIAAADGRQNADDYGNWYHVKTTSGRQTAEEQITVLIPPYLEYIDADAFPKSADACRADTGYTLPDNCAVSCSAHLREKTSTRSTDLGLYQTGTLMELLGQEAGDPYAWYHVRIGSVEGYMTGLYVDAPGSDCSMKPLQNYAPLPVAKVKKSIQLKKGTGLFDGAVTKLPAGTKMHVLAERGAWLHVMVPQNGDPGWLMDPDGADGYVKAGDVLTAATSLQLDWME